MSVSLTGLYLPEYTRIIEAAHSAGLADPRWYGPEFKARRARSGNPAGRIYGVYRVVVYVRPHTKLVSIYETMVHEVAHALTMSEAIDHGPKFREERWRLMRARWPGLEWKPVYHPGKQGAYLEDEYICKALEHMHPHLSTTHAQFERLRYHRACD